MQIGDVIAELYFLFTSSRALWKLYIQIVDHVCHSNTSKTKSDIDKITLSGLYSISAICGTKCGNSLLLVQIPIGLVEGRLMDAQLYWELGHLEDRSTP